MGLDEKVLKKYPAFRDFMEGELRDEEEDYDNIEDIYNHGADAGYPYLSYYHDTNLLYDHYEEEIWDALEEDADSMGESILGMISNFGRADSISDNATLKNLLTWYMAERVAREVIEEEDED